MAAPSSASSRALTLALALLVWGCPVALAPIDETSFACVDSAQCGTGHECIDKRCVMVDADAGAAIPDTAAGDSAQAADRGTDDGGTDDGGTDDGGTDDGATRIGDDLYALYTFDEGSGDQVHDVSGSGAAGDLTIENMAGVTWVSGGLEMNTGSSQTLALSTGAPQELITACQSSDALTIEAWITAAQLTDDGPGRIVTCSADSGNRNFTLAQGTAGLEDVWTVRLRTDLGPDQGSVNGVPNIWTRPGTTSTARTHLVFTHSESAGVLRVYLDGVEVDLDREGAAGVYLAGMPRSGGYSTWNSGYRLGLGGELNAAGGTRAWAGVYHLVAIYCRALSAGEVAQKFAAGPG